MDNYWGALTVLIFLTEEELQNNYVREELKARQCTDNFTVVHCLTREELVDNLRTLDTPEIKVIKLHGHGSSMVSGTIFNAISGGVNIDILPVLNQMRYKNRITLDFMSVCFQNEIPIRDFRHLVTTSEKLKSAVGHQGIEQSFQLYSLPYSEDRVPSIEGKLGYYKVHY